MIKQLTILSTGTFFFLFVSWASTPVRADCPHNENENHQHCRSGGSGTVFEFVGFTDEVTGTVDGTVGSNVIHAACQAEFGSNARFGTSMEYLLKVGHTTPPVDAWVQAILSFSPFTAGSPNCHLWLTENPEGISGAVITPNGSVNQLLCNVQRPVTCSAPVN